MLGNVAINILLHCFDNVWSFSYIEGGTPGVSHAEASRKGVDSKVYTLENFVHQAEIDHLNMFMLVDFFKKSKIGQKVIFLLNIYMQYKCKSF